MTKNCSEIEDLLNDLSSYPGETTKIEVRETHISKVFLTETHAYKLKKPVKFDFLDFSTDELRRQACEAEVQLNRRLAPNVYQGTVPITRKKSGQLAIDGKGDPVDWLVKMRRLPDDWSLDALIRSGRLSNEKAVQMADWLSHFYDSQPPISLEPTSFRKAINEHVIANRRDLLQLPEHFSDHVVMRVHTAQLSFLHLHPEVFDNRVRDGRIVEGHGDLKPEHIYLAPEPLAIDCIEFNKEFRQVDVVDELSFLAMECRLLGAKWVGDRVIDRYVAISRDQFPTRLLEFYMAYRACVRAKVQLIQAHQANEDEHRRLLAKADQYLQLADAITRKMDSPMLLVVRGLSGVGKSTLARHLAGVLGADLFQTDHVRQEILGAPQAYSKYNDGRYSPGNRQLAYEALFDRASRTLGTGVSVVLDGAFLSNTLQNQAAKIADAWGAKLLLINVGCPSVTVKERIESRQQSGDSHSEADFSVYEKQMLEVESPPDSIPQCNVDSTCAIGAQGESVFASLRMQETGR